MGGFFDRILGRNSKGSGATAKQRLQFVLVHDRINLPPEKLQAMKQEILAVISKYVNVDEENVDIALQQGDRRGSMLVAEIPFTKPTEGIDKDDDDDLKPLDTLLKKDGPVIEPSMEKFVATQDEKSEDKHNDEALDG
jgi:cell division topological specificity factor MinE